ncbi:MAG: hypothetical protein HYW47_00645 [Deltaproteobacteria bacterium]|nr:hypothetical protein [Deltaproteobacteria bacterium]
MKYMFRIGIFILCLIPFLSHSYYGLRSTEATLTFSTVLEALASDINFLKLNEGDRHETLPIIEQQLDYLVGAFQSESFYKEFGYKGVLGENHHYKVTFKKIENTSDPQRKKIHYDFEGTVVFDKEAFGGKSYKRAIRKVPIKLPLEPDKIYDLSFSKKFNPCTDREYNSKEDFWYFWDPDLPQCRLKKDNINVVRTQGRLKRKKSTKLSYPEYDKLYSDNGNGETLDIALFFGYMDDVDVHNFENSKRVKRRKKDDAYKAYRTIIKELQSRGFKKIVEKELFRVYRDGNRDGKNSFAQGLNFLTQLEKTSTSKLKTPLNIRIQILLTDTSIESKDYTFHYYVKPAFENADIILYDGHSGLGGNLDLTSRDFQDIQFNKDKYQIYFFNGCSTYPYFKGQFFTKKGGTHNLEIITSGLPTYSTTSVPNTFAFLDYFLEGKTRSYQKILQNLTQSNFEEEEDLIYLMGVNGDEDNIWKP